MCFSTLELNKKLNSIIDTAIENKNEDVRNYLGCSIIGNPCVRASYYNYLYSISKDRSKFKGVNPSGRIKRIFQRGHNAEDMAIEWFKGAGFDLRTRNSKNEQFEVSFLNGKLKGHVDGILVDCKLKQPIQFPCLWECKCLGSKGWKEINKKRLRFTYPTYFGQMQLYMLGLKLDRGLITCINADDMEIYHELIFFEYQVAENLLKNAEIVLNAVENNTIPDRAFKTRTMINCKMCKFAVYCWNNEG